MKSDSSHIRRDRHKTGTTRGPVRHRGMGRSANFLSSIILNTLLAAVFMLYLYILERKINRFFTRQISFFFFPRWVIKVGWVIIRARSKKDRSAGKDVRSDIEVIEVGNSASELPDVLPVYITQSWKKF